MPSKFNPGDRVFLIESGREIREVTVAKFAGGFYTVRFANGKGGIKVRESRLFATKDEANSASARTLPEAKSERRYKSPWDN